MYKPWVTVNIFMISFLHLLQGSDYENGSVKVGDLYLLIMLIINIARITQPSWAGWWVSICFGEGLFVFILFCFGDCW